MILFIFFFHFVLSTLKFGDNPYKILGVSKKATKQEIKSAFRKLTLKYHPDLNKKKDTTATWVKINDAFELLNDPDRKAQYDRTGSLSEEVIPKQPKEDPFQDVNEHFMTNQKVVNVIPTTPLLSALNFDNFVSEPLQKNMFSMSYINNEPEIESIILIYSSVLCTGCDIYLEMFEEFALQFSSYVKCGRIDVSTSFQLAEDIGAKGYPSFVYYKKNLTSGKVETKFLTDEINTPNQISSFLISQWDVEIHVISSLESFGAFINYYDKRIKVIEIVKRMTEASSIKFDRFAGKHKEKALFAIIEHKNFSIANQYDIRTFPSYLMFRTPDAEPLIFNSIESLTLGIENYQGPVMTELTRLNFPQMCGQSCLVRIGKAPPNVIEDLNYQYFSTFWIDENSKAAKILGAKPNEWVEIDFNRKQYNIIHQKGSNETDTLKNSGSFSRSIDTHRLPDNFNVDLQFETIKLWVSLKIEWLMSKLTFSVFDGIFTCFVFGSIIYRFISGFLESRKLNKARDEKYHRKSKKKVDSEMLVNKNVEKANSTNTLEEDEKPLTLDDYDPNYKPK